MVRQQGAVAEIGVGQQGSHEAAGMPAAIELATGAQLAGGTATSSIASRHTMDTKRWDIALVALAMV